MSNAWNKIDQCVLEFAGVFTSARGQMTPSDLSAGCSLQSLSQAEFANLKARLGTESVNLASSFLAIQAGGFSTWQALSDFIMKSYVDSCVLAFGISYTLVHGGTPPNVLSAAIIPAPKGTDAVKLTQQLLAFLFDKDVETAVDPNAVANCQNWSCVSTEAKRGMVK